MPCGWRARRPVVIVNPTLPIGPGDLGRSPPTQMILDFCRGRRREYLDAELNLIDVRDVAEGMVRAMQRGRTGRRYLLGHENLSIHEVFLRLARLTGLPEPRWRVPYGVALTAAYVSEFLADVVTHRTPAATVTGVKLTRRRMHFDARRSLEELGLEPRPVAQSLADAVAWFRQIAWLPQEFSDALETCKPALPRSVAKRSCSSCRHHGRVPKLHGRSRSGKVNEGKESHATAGCLSGNQPIPLFHRLPRPILPAARRHRTCPAGLAAPATARRPLGRRAAGRHDSRIRIHPAHGVFGTGGRRTGGQGGALHPGTADCPRAAGTTIRKARRNCPFPSRHTSHSSWPATTRKRRTCGGPAK